MRWECGLVTKTGYRVSTGAHRVPVKVTFGIRLASASAAPRDAAFTDCTMSVVGVAELSFGKRTVCLLSCLSKMQVRFGFPSSNAGR